MWTRWADLTHMGRFSFSIQWGIFPLSEREIAESLPCSVGKSEWPPHGQTICCSRPGKAWWGVRSEIDAPWGASQSHPGNMEANPMCIFSTQLLPEVPWTLENSVYENGKCRRSRPDACRRVFAHFSPCSLILDIVLLSPV